MGTLVSFGDISKGETIAMVMGQKEPAEGEDNGLIIAAAPDLYEALHAIRTFMWAEGYEDQTSMMAQADAAIAKAEGEDSQ